MWINIWSYILCSSHRKIFFKIKIFRYFTQKSNADEKDIIIEDPHSLWNIDQLLSIYQVHAKVNYDIIFIAMLETELNKRIPKLIWDFDELDRQ